MSGFPKPQLSSRMMAVVQECEVAWAEEKELVDDMDY